MKQETWGTPSFACPGYTKCQLRAQPSLGQKQANQEASVGWRVGQVGPSIWTSAPVALKMVNAAER